MYRKCNFLHCPDSQMAFFSSVVNCLQLCMNDTGNKVVDDDCTALDKNIYRNLKKITSKNWRLKIIKRISKWGAGSVILIKPMKPTVIN